MRDVPGASQFSWAQERATRHLIVSCLGWLHCLKVMGIYCREGAAGFMSGSVLMRPVLMQMDGKPPILPHTTTQPLARMTTLASSQMHVSILACGTRAIAIVRATLDWLNFERSRNPVPFSHAMVRALLIRHRAEILCI